jgi:hypothetical protein
MSIGAVAADVATLLSAARRRGIPIDFVPIDEPTVMELYERRLVLVRPDGHVAWRDDRAPVDPVAVIDRVRGAAPGVAESASPQAVAVSA